MPESTSTLVKEYLVTHGGDLEKFKYFIRGKQRLGQAFFNSLSDRDKRRLRGSIHDPFHVNRDQQLAKVKEAIE